LVSFAKNWDKFKVSATTNAESNPQFQSNVTVIDTDETDEEDNDDFERDGGFDVNNKKCKSCLKCAICCYSVIQKYNMYSEAYSALGNAYKYLLTLSINQVQCERSFSKLKYIKNRLRNSMSNNNLDAFMLMACENDILYNIDSDNIIDKLMQQSKLLNRLLKE
jgi:Fe-S-cluster-containing hydrogenase component 2